MSRRRTAAEVLDKMASEGRDLGTAVRSAPERREPEDPTLAALKRNIGKVVTVPPAMLVIEKNVRTILDTDSDEFAALVDDVRQHGVRQNIAVELQEPAEASWRLVVVFGQRRVLAARQAGLEMIPALIVREGDAADRIFLGLAENIFRAEMHPLDRAEAYQELIDSGWSANDLSEKLERRKRTVQGFLRLARFPQQARDLIRQHPEAFTTHLLFNRFLGRAWKSESDLINALAEIVSRKSASSTTRTRTRPRAPETKVLLEAAGRFAGLPCRTSGTADSGKLVVSWRNRDELLRLLQAFDNSTRDES